MSNSKEETLKEMGKIFKESGLFKDFYGSVTFNIAGGECKNIAPYQVIDGIAGVKQTILPDKK